MVVLTVRLAVTDPGEVFLPGYGPGLKVLLVLGDTGERHTGRLVVLTGLVARLPARLERPPGPGDISGLQLRSGGAQVRRRVTVCGCALGCCDLFGDGADLLLAEV